MFASLGRIWMSRVITWEVPVFTNDALNQDPDVGLGVTCREHRRSRAVCGFAAAADPLEFHRQKVAELGNHQAFDLAWRFEQVLRASLVCVKELHFGGGEKAVQGAR